MAHEEYNFNYIFAFLKEDKSNKMQLVPLIPFSDTPEPSACPRASGCPGQTVSLCFSVTSDGAAPVELKVSSPFRAEAFLIDERELAGLGLFRSDTVCAKELLLKEEQAEWRDGYRRRFRHWRHVLRPALYYSAPDVRLRGNVKAQLVPNKPKQFWVDVDIPLEANPGEYLGELRIKNYVWTFEVLVSAFRLLEPHQDRMIWYKGSLDHQNRQHFVPEWLFRAQLEDILRHGFSSLSLNEHRFDYAQRAIRIAEEVGFQRQLVFLPPYPKDFHLLTAVHAKIAAYTSDEMDVNGAAEIEGHQKNWEMATRFGLPTMISLLSNGFLSRLAPKGNVACPDKVSLYLPENQDYFSLVPHFEALKKHETYFYWMAHMEKPLLHRALAGAYLWKSGADGIAPYCYQHLPKFPGSPYRESDDWEPNPHSGENQFRHHLVTYPAKGGVIPTLQWKGLREGIYDLRYLETLEAWRPGATSSIEFMKKFPLKSIDINSPTESIPYPQVRAQDFDSFREALREQIASASRDVTLRDTGPGKRARRARW